MMPIKTLPVILIIALFISACSDPERERQLNSREQALLKREAEFALKAADYQSLLLMRDSLLSRHDTIAAQTWPDGLEGMWNGKSVCQESDCNDYVVGDQRSDTWMLTGDSTSIFAKLLSKDKLLRVYSAKADSNGVRLHFKTDSLASRRVDISITLQPVSAVLLKGTQTINVNDNCSARFAVELVRAPKQQL